MGEAGTTVWYRDIPRTRREVCPERVLNQMRVVRVFFPTAGAGCTRADGVLQASFWEGLWVILLALLGLPCFIGISGR